MGTDRIGSAGLGRIWNFFGSKTTRFNANGTGLPVGRP